MRGIMKALIIKNNNLEYTDVPAPCIGDNEVLVKVSACGISGKDIENIRAAGNDGVIAGSEFVGTVVKVGNRRHRDMIGSRVAAISYNTCKSCECCRTNHANLCANIKQIGSKAGWGKRDFYPGAMAQYCQVWADHCYPLPEGLSDEEAALMEPMALGLAAVRKAANMIAEDTLVIGAGTVGLSIAQCLKLQGARRIYVIDITGKHMETIKQLGGLTAIDVSRENAAETIKSHMGEGSCRSVFDTVGTYETQNWAHNSLAVKGEIINTVANTDKLSYKLMYFSGERSITNIITPQYKDMYDTLRLLEDGKIMAKPLIMAVYPIENYKEAFRHGLQTADGNDFKTVIKI